MRPKQGRKSARKAALFAEAGSRTTSPDPAQPLLRKLALDSADDTAQAEEVGRDIRTVMADVHMAERKPHLHVNRTKLPGVLPQRVGAAPAESGDEAGSPSASQVSRTL